MFKKEVAEKLRAEFNADILMLLADYFKANPDMRFQQGLYNLGFVDTDDQYNVESDNDFHRLLKLVRQELGIKSNDTKLKDHPFISKRLKDHLKAINETHKVAEVYNAFTGNPVYPKLKPMNDIYDFMAKYNLRMSVRNGSHVDLYQAIADASEVLFITLDLVHGCLQFYNASYGFNHEEIKVLTDEIRSRKQRDERK